MKCDLSVVVPASRPQSLAHILGYLNSQSAAGVNYEFIIVQEADNFELFQTLSYSPRCRVLRQAPSHDNGATARDAGLIVATGSYVTFWDDDNIYYPHAVAALFATALGYDVGVCRVRHRGLVIPVGKNFQGGDIDSMCLCVRKEVAAKVKWADHGGRYNDYRWIMRVAVLVEPKAIRHCPLIVGEHL